MFDLPARGDNCLHERPAGVQVTACHVHECVSSTRYHHSFPTHCQSKHMAQKPLVESLSEWSSETTTSMQLPISFNKGAANSTFWVCAPYPFLLSSHQHVVLQTVPHLLHIYTFTHLRRPRLPP